VLFDSGSADLKPQGKKELDKFVETFLSLRDQIPSDLNVNIQIQGHTDTDPTVSSRWSSNWELSTARATRVVGYLAVRGIPESLLSAAGFSQYDPLVRDDTVAAKAQNRRIEIVITQR